MSGHVFLDTNILVYAIEQGGPDPAKSSAALELASRFQLSYYDALIVSAARYAGCQTLFSEDLNNNQNYAGVAVANPFHV